MFSSIFRTPSHAAAPSSIMQKIRRTSGHVTLVCALVAAGIATPTWAKPGKNNASGKSATKATAHKSAKAKTDKIFSKNGATKTVAKSADKKTAGKGQALVSAKRSAASKAGRNHKLAAESTVTAHNKKHGKAADKTPSAQDLRRQIAALQAKGGKSRQLSKVQKQQLARLTAQAQQAEKAERQAKQEQARALRLAAAAPKNKQHPAPQAAPASTTLARNNPSTQPVQQAAISPAQQENVLALQAPVISSANTATLAAAAPAATRIAPSNSAAPTAPATHAGMAAPQPPQMAQAATAPVLINASSSPSSNPMLAAPAVAAPTQPDPLQALLDAKQAEFAAATTAPALTTAAPVTAPAAAQAAAIATVSAPGTTVASATPARKPESPSPIIRVSVPSRSSLGQIQGLSTPRGNFGPDLYSSVAFAMDQKTGQVLVNKNGHFVSPIASITKLMTAVITMDANLPMDEMITITDEDIDRLKGSRSRLAVGTRLSRQELLHLALMSSENRAAHALGRTYPGGLSAAIRAMNRRALMLGMRETRYVEPTGLSSANQSSAHDLALLVKAAYRYPLIRNYTTYPGAEFAVQGQMMRFNNTNRLIHSPDWNIGLQKTGFISEAGRCVVMQSNIGGRNVIIVLLDSSATNLRAQDAEAIRYWVQNNGSRPGRDASSIIARTDLSHVY